MKVLIIGYGNVDRQDDGVAYHVLVSVMQSLGLAAPENMEEEDLASTDNLSFRFQMQLIPELTEELAEYTHVCFIDAHTGNVPEDVHFENLSAQYQRSPFTHHMTASTLLSLTETIHHRVPNAILISVRGVEFGFTQTLSAFTANQVPHAAEIVIHWLRQIGAI